MVPKILNKQKHYIATGIIIILPVLLTATLLFYFIPVSESIGTAPSQVVVAYGTAFILVGGYIVYKVILKKQSSLQRAIKETNTKYKSMPDHEVLTAFYKDSITKFQVVTNTLNRLKVPYRAEVKDRSRDEKLQYNIIAMANE